METDLQASVSDGFPPIPSLFETAMEQAAFAALIFAADDKLSLLWRNRAHSRMTNTPGLDIVNRGMFEAFPPHGNGDGAAAMQGIFDAVDRMRQTGDPEEIGPYRFDLVSSDGTYVEHHWLIRMSPIREGGAVTKVLQLAQDVTESVLAKRLSNSLSRAAINTTAVSYFSFDPETGRFIRGEDIDRMFGFEAGEAGHEARSFFLRVHPDDIGGVNAEVERVFAAPRGEIASFDYRVQIPDGAERFIRIRGEVTADPADRREKLVGTFVDLTDLENNRRALVKTLALREALINEANHRIKNSLQIAIIMLRSEARAISSANGFTPQEAIERLQSVQARIHAVANVHSLMQISAETTVVSLNELVKNLVDFSCASVDLADGSIHCTVAHEDTTVVSDTAICIGLIVNELLTNALKYGIDPNREANIAVYVGKNASHTRITVKNGVHEQSKSSGLTSTNVGSLLVDQLSKQIGALVTTERMDDLFIAQLSFKN